MMAANQSMTTTRLVQSIMDKATKKKMEVSKRTASQVIELMLETVADEVRKGGKVTLKNFGVFRRHTKPARPKRMGRNPATGEQITIQAKPKQNVIKFRPAKPWKEAVAKGK